MEQLPAQLPLEPLQLRPQASSQTQPRSQEGPVSSKPQAPLRLLEITGFAKTKDPGRQPS